MMRMSDSFLAVVRTGIFAKTYCCSTQEKGARPTPGIGQSRDQHAVLQPLHHQRQTNHRRVLDLARKDASHGAVVSATELPSLPSARISFVSQEWVQR